MPKTSLLRVAVLSGIVMMALTGLAEGAVLVLMLAPSGQTWPGGLTAALVLPMVVGGITTGVVSLVLGTVVLRPLVELFKVYDRMATIQPKAQLRLRTDLHQYFRQRGKGWTSKQASQMELLRDRDDFRKNFIGNLAHELKTPLMSIQGFIISLLEGAIDDPAHSRKFLTKASKNAERMMTLVQDLDVITREESGRLDINILDFDVIDLIQETFESAENQAQRVNIQLRIDKDSPGSLFARGDNRWITQVMSNLVINSINYGQHDGTGETVVRVREEDRKVAIEVQDNGIGIEPESISRIFERFYRVDKSRSRAAGGSGLGLAICKHLIEAHGETITVDSMVGKGSTFRFKLPKA